MFKFNRLKQLFTNRRFLLLLVILVCVASYFWSQSRYPDLDRKAAMGSEMELQATGFDILLPMPEKPTVIRQIFVNSVNWMYTNRKGMTFGMVFGAIMMTMMPFLSGLQSSSRISNSFVGIVIGSPLGLCVNCSTPIAHGMYAKGARPETMLATMISSPTLNIIVLTMLFTLFPPWIAFMKIGATLIFILVWIPLLSRWFKTKDPFEIQPINTGRFATKIERSFSDNLCAISDEDCANPNPQENWSSSVRWVFTNFGRNLWSLTKIALPLMLLAGVLGAILVTVLPLGSLASGLPEGRVFSWLSMGVIALIGLFIPAPMTFDVILSSILYNAGMPVKYVAILLFSLGIFSVYPFMTLWENMSRRVAFSMASVLLVMAVCSGVIANRYSLWDFSQQQKQVFQPFAKTAGPPDVLRVDRTKQGTHADELLPKLEKNALLSEPYSRTDSLEVRRIAFDKSNPLKPNGKTVMRRYFQDKFGITENESYSVLKLQFRYAVSARGLSSGDVNRDGWTDFVLGSEVGVVLYLNKQGRAFEQLRIEIPRLNKISAFSTALVDLNNDGWLDLWISSMREGNLIIYNRNGRFSAENVTSVQNHEDAVLTDAAAFGDIDRDGKLDIVLGNVSLTAKTVGLIPFDSTKNIWLRQTLDGFKMEPLPGINGESLTTLLSDIDQNGTLDLLVGNDLQPPDMVYLGDGAGGFKLLSKTDGLIPLTSGFTMSINSADIDNDLIPELFFGTVSPRGNWRQSGGVVKDKPVRICSELTDKTSRSRCEEFYSFLWASGRASKRDRVWDCNKMVKMTQRDACIASALIQSAVAFTRNKELCGFFPPDWEYFSVVCDSSFAPRTRIQNDRMEAAIPQRVHQNVFLKMRRNGVFEDKAADFGVGESGWTWNSKFTDLDNDGWKDLFVVNGWLGRKRESSNYFYRNLEGKGFEDKTQEFGLSSLLKTSSFTDLDIDNDGDLDIIVAPTVGPISIYVNQTIDKESIAFELNDKIGNYFGIGSKIIINYGDGQHQMRELQASGGYISYDAPIAYFGLDKVKTVDSVEIEWSTGEKSVINKEFKSGARYVISRSK